jgi:hypothetical protein
MQQVSNLRCQVSPGFKCGDDWVWSQYFSEKTLSVSAALHATIPSLIEYIFKAHIWQAYIITNIGYVLWKCGSVEK